MISPAKPSFSIYYQLWCNVTIQGHVQYRAQYYLRPEEGFESRPFLNLEITPSNTDTPVRIMMAFADEPYPGTIQAIRRYMDDNYLIQDGYNMLREYMQGDSEVLPSNKLLGQLIFASDYHSDEFM